MGAAQSLEEARNLAIASRSVSSARHSLDLVWKQWSEVTRSIQLETPNKALNALANGWLVYQTLGCRLWARAATYQSGGAFGFRDQLQDVMALIYSRPDLTRAQLLLCAGHQFLEGDVQHWWHPPTGRGVRTRISDDFLWLPLVTSRYVETTGDTGVLDEKVHFLEGRSVSLEEDSYYDLPIHSDQEASLYEHCVRAIKHSLRFGQHGLPLMGTGDWNDGMNLVGEKGRGESVWLGFFLYDILGKFSKIAQKQNDTLFSELCLSESKKLSQNLESNGWDGDWYRRAFFDDGTMLGSSLNDECRIDSIAQSWSVLSGVGSLENRHRAMQSLDSHLVRRTDGLIQLLDPPFDKSDLDPGYIKGYAPGVRENGGQYTHAAIWATMAFAELGDRKKAWELFNLINPINHSNSEEEMKKYRVEPYVMAADVYAINPHVGRGGWTWYTGSAAWMYRLIIESLLGLELKVDRLRFKPCLPVDWEGFRMHYRFRQTMYHINVIQTLSDRSSLSMKLDGRILTEGFIPLIDDRNEHWAEVNISIDQ